MFWLSLAAASLRNRRLTAGLTILSIALSVALVLSVERLRVDTRSSFTNTLSGTDLIVGARTSALNLLLYSVFRLGDASNNIDWNSYQVLRQHPSVDWTVPLSLGDSHQGYRVLGTTTDYFTHYRYARKKSLAFARGQAFEQAFEVVLGADVARTLNYQLGDSLILSHGVGKVSFSTHDEFPFTVVGVLAPTGTPVDRTLHVSLAGIEVIHLPPSRAKQLIEQGTLDSLEPQSITAFMVGMQSRIHTFAFQRYVNEYPETPVMAIIPGAALQSLWQVLSVVERVFWAISGLVLATGLLGMLSVILASLSQRRREMALFRALGVSASRVYLLLCGEALLYGVFGALLGLSLHIAAVVALGPWLSAYYGISLSLAGVFSLPVLYWLLAVMGIAGLLGCLPATQAYRQTLSDGLTMRT